jgi:hypothetical protein
LITALTGAFVAVYVAVKGAKKDVQDEIHLAVNSNMAAAVKKIDEGMAELRAAKEEISRLKADAVAEIKAELGRFREDQLPPTRKGR